MPAASQLTQLWDLNGLPFKGGSLRQLPRHGNMRASRVGPPLETVLSDWEAVAEDGLDDGD